MSWKFITHNEFDLQLLMDPRKLTCKIIESSFKSGDVNIPRIIKYEDKEYRLTTIGNNAFKDNKRIKSFKCSEDTEIKSIFMHSFENSSLESIIIPPKVKKINEFAFSRCYFLHTVTFPSNSQLQSIKASSFYFSNINFIKIPASVQMISDRAFCDCRNLKTVEFHPKSKLKSICNLSFYQCSSLEEITIPKSVILIGDYAFACCSKLEKVCIAEDSNLETIGRNAFGYTSIKHFFISPKLSNIDCFGNSNLNDISISPHNPNFALYNNAFVIGKSKSEVSGFDVLYFALCDVEKAVIPSFISVIRSNAFFLHKKLKTLEFDDNSKIELIEDEAFGGSTIESVSIPSSIMQINKYAFAHCSNLRHVVFSEKSNCIRKDDKPMEIQKNAFICNMLETIEFLGNCMKIGDARFFYSGKFMILACPDADCICFEFKFNNPSNSLIFVKANSRIMEKL